MFPYPALVRTYKVYLTYSKYEESAHLTMLHVEYIKDITSSFLHTLFDLGMDVCLAMLKNIFLHGRVSSTDMRNISREVVTSHHMSYNINNILYFILILFCYKIGYSKNSEYVTLLLKYLFYDI